MNASLFQELGLLDCAVFQYVKNDQFAALYDSAEWFSTLFSANPQDKLYTLNETPFYLVDFLYEANEFWGKSADGKISSGIWSEEVNGLTLRLEAQALTLKGKCYLIVFNIENEFNKQQKTLQRAREFLISNDTVLERHELAWERIAEFSSGLESIESNGVGIKKLVDDIKCGIAIVDGDMKPIKLSSTLYNIFEMKEETGHTPFDLLLKLCHKQFPELSRTLKTNSRFNSELYWLAPPALSRWLQVTIYPIKTTRLGNQKCYWLFLITDISREKYLKQSDEKLAYFDILTNLPNRQYFWRYLEDFIEAKQSLCVMILDIKQLKRVNENFGFSVGDNVIKEVVARVASLLNSNDVLARIGGNELAIILHQKEFLNCETIALNMISAVSKPYYILDQYACDVGLSVGIATYPDDASNTEDLMRYADLALFSAKQSVKSTAHFYSIELKNNFIKRMNLEKALQEAVDTNQFELYLQPIFDLTSGNITQAEVLIRWRRPNIGMISPAEFIPVAEQTGLIVDIGQWVISETMKLLAELHRDHHKIKLSVNLSPAQVSDAGLLRVIKNNLKSSAIDPSYFELELTEGVLVNDFDKVSHFLQEIRELGMSVAIDDFGTGYSSLSYLQKLPIDYLKIDQSFIFQLMEHKSNQGIVKAIISMAESLGLEVIAEGVETEAQKTFLKMHDCQFVQGYLFSRPLPYESFCQLLEHKVSDFE